MYGFRYLTFLYSCSLTVLWALEQSGLKGGVRVEEAKELTLHLVGTRDCVQTVFWEYFYGFFNYIIFLEKTIKN